MSRESIIKYTDLEDILNYAVELTQPKGMFQNFDEYKTIQIDQGKSSTANTELWLAALLIAVRLKD